MLGWWIVALGVVTAVPALANNDAALVDLRSQCYDVYKAQYDDARAYLPAVASQDINLDALDLPPSFQEQFGVSTEDLAGLSDALKQANEFMAPYAQEAYLALAQINIDLADCYLAHGANAQALRDQAQANYDAIQAYDFQQAFNSTPTGTPTVTVPAQSTTQVRLRAYCLDSGRSVPDVGEEYYLAGTLDQLQGDGLCQTIQAAQNFNDVSAAQGAIWSTNTALQPSSELDGITPGNGTQTVQATERHPIALGAAAVGGGLVLFSILALALHWVPKPLSISGIIIGVGLAIAGVASATEIAQPSLHEAAQQQQIIVKATATGSFTALDVAITNLTATDLTLSTTCLRFVPKTVSFDPDLSTSYDNYDFNIEDITSGEVDWEELEDSYNETEGDEGHQAQRLGTGDIIDDNPPPLPPPPPEPEDTLDLEELKRKVKDQVDAAKKAFEENPTEDNLRDLIEEAQKCLAIGCGDDDPLGDVGKNWQKNIDEAAERYRQDPSDLNREALERAAEIGQMFGSDTDAAVDILVT